MTETSYSHELGSGNRVGKITITTNARLNEANKLDNWIDGTQSGSTPYIVTGSLVVGTYLTFDFKKPVVVDEALLLANGQNSFGTWKWQGSSNNSVWVDIGSNFDFKGSSTKTQKMTSLNGNIREYRYYRLICVIPSTSGLNYMYQFEFKVKNGYLNKTLILNNGEYKKFNEEVPAISDNVNAIPIMTSDTAPKGVASSSGFRSGFPPYHAFDNNSATMWRLDALPTNGNSWIMYEFEKPKIVEKIEFGSFNLSGGNHGVKNFEFSGSNDGVDFTILHSGVHPNNANLIGYSFSNSTQYKMYRLSVISSYTSYTAVTTLNMYEKKADKIHPYWSTVSTTLPTSTKFQSEGMDNLSPLLDRTVTELESMSMTDKSEILNEGEVGKVFSKTIDLKKYIDIRSIKVEVK
ncbi:hypothetical protein ABIA69_002189 [Lysinibacillus parviboronicapiens]|uniref:F5/8 type C domain-containing protein n=1 Tax=Lysinibacillus parviboronicapiens TaxID=436516 RepID=A0ABV2PJD3_9BACI